MKINVNGVTLNYEKKGEGSPLILLHGNGEDLCIFDALGDKLKRHFTVYAVDSRNHGMSSMTGDYRYEVMANDILSFVNELKLDDVSVIGFSDGAIVSLILALKHENLFRKMVLLGVNLQPADFKKKEYNFLINEYKKTKDPLVKLMLEQPDIKLDALSAINVPVLVVGAQYDVFYRKTFRDIANVIPQGQLKIVKGHDHGSYIVDSDILYPDLKEFLQ